MQVFLGMYPPITCLVASEFQVSNACRGERVHSFRETKISGCYRSPAASFTGPGRISEHSNTNGILVSVRCDTPSLSERRCYRGIICQKCLLNPLLLFIDIVTTFV